MRPLSAPVGERRRGHGPDDGPAWAYKLVSMGNPLEPDVEARANAFGRQGWELVAIDAGVWVFKRQGAPSAAVAEGEASARQEIEEAVPLADARAAAPVLSVPLTPGP